MAPSSGRSSQCPRSKYDVFLSFRVEDTPITFTSHLYQGLKTRGIFTFQDDKRLEQDASISEEHLRAIEESQVYVIIFSKNYASSSWCLDELVKIMEHTDRYGQRVIPVFYNVDPSTILYQNESFADAFTNHESRYKVDDVEGKLKVKRWRAALIAAANLKGCVIHNGDEAKYVELIVKVVSHSLEVKVSSIKKHLVGIRSRAKEVKSLLNVDLGGVYFVGICGMGGVGKTTVARAIFHEISNQFEGSCFLENISEISKKHGPEGLQHLQKKLLSQIMRQHSLTIASAHEGVKMMSRVRHFKKVLIVLDDVDNDDQLECLVGDRHWFGDGSRIITTTRSINLLRKHNQLYSVPELSMYEALELFSWHAFHEVTPNKEFENLSICIVNYANGLPLALQRLGSFLYKRDFNEWISTLDRLKDTDNPIPSTSTEPMAYHKELIQKWNYDVFLSFRGEDTRNNFVSHLYKRMKDLGIYAFKDNVTLERGKFISPELLKAIEESKFSIIIFSENYASSTWCLEELTKIMECVETKGQEAIPIFYNVDPSDVRLLRNSFATAMAKHKENLKGIDLKKVQRWRDALHKAANIAGWDVRETANGDEAKCIELILNNISRSVGMTVSSNRKHLVGIRSRVNEVNSLLNAYLGGVYFVGIWGMGGVGKTTVARAIFDEISDQFEGSCFLANVREISTKHGPEGPEHLQKKLLSQIMKQHSLIITSADEGVKMISRMLCFKKVLIVLDDVDNNFQLEYLVGKREWFGDGSRIIITTRNIDLLRKHDQLYHVPELAINEALELFSWHAFQQGTPDKEFENLSTCVVNYANGLPLALEVLGSFLCKRGMIEWRSTLDRLKDIGDGEIVKQLSLSLDGLSHEDKDIFLDIACFFRGKKKDDVITILNSLGYKSEIGIDILIKRSVLYISEGMVEMHDLIEQMGQQVARDTDQDQPWKHSRLWHDKDIETVFSENLGTESVKGIMVPIGSDQYICKWSNGFRKMPCLRLLMVKGEEVRHYEPVSDTIEYLPSSLKWLDWSYYSFESLPANFQPRNLVGLNMTFSSLVKICKEPKAFVKLTILNLSFSVNLLQTPNFSETPNLKRIILKGCLSLVEVHPSLGSLKRLISLNMENCKKLENLPSGIQMKSIESLNLSGCEKLEKLPEIQENMELLSELLLRCTGIWEVPSSIGRLSGISFLDLRSCKYLVRFPDSITEMKKLKVLILKGCSKFENFPKNLGDLRHLEELYADNTAIQQLPDSFRELSRLKVLSLRKGRKVKCQSSLSFEHPSPLEGLSELKRLDLSGCNLSVYKAYALIYLTSLIELNLSRNKLTFLDGVAALSQLRYLNITHCQELKKFPRLPPSIKELYAEDFLAMQSVIALWIYPSLYLVSFTNYSFDQQPYTEKGVDNSVFDQILSFFLSDTKVNAEYAPSYYRKGISIVFPGCGIPTWFKYQSVEEKIMFQLPEDWYDYNFQGFAICCVTSMGAGVYDPAGVYDSVSGLSGKYDYAFIKAKLTCNNHLEKIKVLEKECKVGTASKTNGWCVCFVYIPLYFLLETYVARNLNQYGLFEVSINNHIARKWGVHPIYEADRQFFRSRLDKKLLGPSGDYQEFKRLKA